MDDEDRPTPNTPFTNLQLEIVCLRRELDRVVHDVAHLSRLVTAFVERPEPPPPVVTIPPILGTFTPKQRAGILTGTGGLLVAGAYSLFELTNTLKELLRLVLQLRGLDLPK